MNEEEELPDFGEKKYWDDLYTKKLVQNDWYVPWSHLRPLIDKWFEPNTDILHVGCGNSRISFYLAEFPFNRIINMDYSSIVIEQMKRISKHIPKLEWEVGDCLDMKYQDSSFDIILDKGALDAILCNDIDPIIKGEKYATEAFRILKPNGTFIVLSYGIPAKREPIFQKNNMFKIINEQTVTNQQDKSDHYHLYTMQKCK